MYEEFVFLISDKIYIVLDKLYVVFIWAGPIFSYPAENISAEFQPVYDFFSVIFGYMLTPQGKYIMITAGINIGLRLLKKITFELFWIIMFILMVLSYFV